MSLQNILDPEAVKKDWTQLYAKSLSVVNVETDNITITGNAPTTFFDLEVTNELQVDGLTDIGGNNYVTPDLGSPNYSLHTDGAGSTYWAPDDTGSSDVSYSGVPPTVVGQLSRFSSTTGGNIDQSGIIDDGANLNLNNQNITNVNLVDGVDISAFKSDYDSKVDQDVRTISAPSFSGLTVKEDPFTNVKTVCAFGNSELQLNSSFTNWNIINTPFSSGDLLIGVGGQNVQRLIASNRNTRFFGDIECQNNDITNVNLVDGVDISSFKSDYDSKVNQDVRTTASPTFSDTLTMGGGAGVSTIELNTSTNNPTIKLIDFPTLTEWEVRNGGGQFLQFLKSGSPALTINPGALESKFYGDIQCSNNDIVDVNLVDGVDISAFKSDYDSKVNQDVRTSATPSFAGMSSTGVIDIGTGPNNYVLPNTSAGVSDNSILAFNATTKNLEFKPPVSYILQYGGNLTTVNDFMVPNGDPTFALNGVLDNSKEVVVPVNSSIYDISYSNISGDATTQTSLWVNGVSVGSINLTGNQGILNLPSPINLTAGDTITISYSGGTAPGQANAILSLRFQ